MKYDPRNPPEEALISTDSEVPSHKNLKLTIVLLKLNDVYFIVEGMSIYPSSYDELQSNERYLYEEHHCPTNFIPVLKITHNGDTDPHGIFEHIESIWMTDESKENLDKIFPQIIKKV